MTSDLRCIFIWSGIDYIKLREAKLTVQPTLRERRKQETHRFILDAAFRLLASQGYGQTSVDAIIAEAGLSKGAFYHHFPKAKRRFSNLF